MDLKMILENHEKWLRQEGGKRANLNDANLIKANLRSANLRYSHLQNADLRGADLQGVSFCGADLYGAKFLNSNICSADFYGAKLWGAKGIYQFGPMPTSERVCYAVWHSDHWRIQAGCFWGTVDELKERVMESHKCPVYLANIELLKNWKYETNI